MSGGLGLVRSPAAGAWRTTCILLSVEHQAQSMVILSVCYWASDDNVQQKDGDEYAPCDIPLQFGTVLYLVSLTSMNKYMPCPTSWISSVMAKRRTVFEGLEDGTMQNWRGEARGRTQSWKAGIERAS